MGKWYIVLGVVGFIYFLAYYKVTHVVKKRTLEVWSLILLSISLLYVGTSVVCIITSYDLMQIAIFEAVQFVSLMSIIEGLWILYIVAGAGHALFACLAVIFVLGMIVVCEIHDLYERKTGRKQK